ncbi:MAG: mannose-phosphate guanylyltransferase/mannose-6-phosphate isomerase [Noviherbaspirillum sp.]|nr:mannose-phosphate guanylyltransferase/mannose-6-phosphate isomerase [Noviherbaspirillum sp.]
MKTINPVILCGGAGTRLWPLSRESFPKQFVPLIGGKSLLRVTLERVSLLASSAVCVANDEHRFLVQEAIAHAGIQASQLLEPVGRNTAAAMACAALQAGQNDLLLFLPADHYIPDAEAFAATVRSGIDAAQAGHIVTFGVQPTFPSSAYGYIQKGRELVPGGVAATVSRFIEKPAPAIAQEMLLTGGYLWNAGIFLVRADTLIAALEKHAADILTACRTAVDKRTQDGNFIRLDPDAFRSCRSESIDFAVLEHHDKVSVVPFLGAWSDVGSWNAVAALTDADSDNNRVTGFGHVINASNTYINAQHRPVVALGTQNLLIIDTPDALLVADASHAEQVKQAVKILKDQQSPQATTHRRVARPWGWYDSIDVGQRFQVKRITVNPGAKLSLQMHHHRAEHWVVVRGTARVTNGNEIITLTENQSTYIPIGVPHRLENPGKIPLEMIEVQSGSYLGEDDIVRMDDTYGRVAEAPATDH